jgi:hypothetical protein
VRKQYNFHLLTYSQLPVVRHFTNWCVGFQLWSILTVYDIYCIFHELQHSLARFATSILRCYNFNGIIKWYDISCATLYNIVHAYFMLEGMVIYPFHSILVSLEFSLFGHFCQFAYLEIMYGWSVTACAGMYQWVGQIIGFIYCLVQSVPLPTKPGSSLIILTPITILQRDLNSSTFIAWEMKRNVSVVCDCSAPNCWDTEQRSAS